MENRHLHILPQKALAVLEASCKASLPNHELCLPAIIINYLRDYLTHYRHPRTYLFSKTSGETATGYFYRIYTEILFTEDYPRSPIQICFCRKPDALWSLSVCINISTYQLPPTPKRSCPAHTTCCPNSDKSFHSLPFLLSLPPRGILGLHHHTDFDRGDSHT